MERGNVNAITVHTEVNAPLEKVWECWTEPVHITKWNQASEDWHSPYAENDLGVSGKFKYRMEAKDGSEGFDFAGVYDEVKPKEMIAYSMEDAREVKVTFSEEKGIVRVVETFDPEPVNPFELQEKGWQAILDNFKGYVESL